MKGGKVVLIGASIFLVVGVVVGTIVGVSYHKSSKDEDSKALSSTTKAVAAVCSQTDHKKLCVDSMNSLAKNTSATPKDFLGMAIDVAIQEVKASMAKPVEVGKGATAPAEKMSVEDCKELLDYAVDELQASFSMVGDSNLHTVTDREAELKNWLSAVLSYQTTCVDGFTTPELQKQISNGLLNATQLTDNALAVVTAMSQILQAFNIPANTNPATRKLLDDVEIDNDGFPAWFHVADRKILASKSGGEPPPNAVVAKDGSGQYKTIGAALAAYPKNLKGRYVIYVKAGLYDEYITVEKNMINVYMYGDGPRKTIVTGNKNKVAGVSTFKTASFSAIGAGFICKSMGFQNTAGPQGEQAVALRSQSDMSAFYNCRIDGYQDSLYVQTHRQFYRNCVISGTVDFIFGDASAVIQNSLIIVRKPGDKQQNTVTAHGREFARETTGLVIQNCRIVPEQILEPMRFKIPTFLGRPWKKFSRTVIMESTLGDFIQPTGWMPWAGTFALDTCYYAEYGNRGPGAGTNKRVKWKGYHVIRDRNEALQFTAGPFIQGNQWLKFTGMPHFLGLSN